MGQDMFENQMLQVSTAAFLRCLDASGNSRVITPNDLLGSVFLNRGSLTKYNDTSLKNGIYDDFSTAIDRDPKLIAYGLLFVFAVGESMIVQMHVGTTHGFHTRIFANRSWHDWKSITLT